MNSIGNGLSMINVKLENLVVSFCILLHNCQIANSFHVTIKLGYLIEGIVSCTGIRHFRHTLKYTLSSSLQKSKIMYFSIPSINSPPTVPHDNHKRVKIDGNVT